MKKIFSAYIVLLSAIFFSACGNDSKRNDDLYTMLSQGLENSTNSINANTTLILHQFEKKLYDPITIDKARIWHPAIKLVTDYTSGILFYLKGLKQKKNLNKKEATELHERCIKYRANIFNVSPKIKMAFENNSTLFSHSFDSSANQINSFYKTFFAGISHDAFIAVLDGIINNIKMLENKVVIFCNEQINSTIFIQETFSTIAIANKNYLKPGEFIEITAGVGGFNTKVQPEFIINRKAVTIDMTDGAAHYKMKAPLDPGNYSIPVRIIYTDQNGFKQINERNIQYTVAKECDQ